MQRVAVELHEALASRDDVALHSEVLRSTWRMTHVKTIPFLLRTLFRIRRAVRRQQVDVILFSSMVTAALAVPLRRYLRRHGVATAAIVHGRDVTLDLGVYQWFVPQVFGAVDLILPVSRATGSACTARGLPSSRMHVVPNGVSLARFEDEVPKATARRRLVDTLGFTASHEDAMILCSVGRQVERKGFAWFAEHVMPLLPADVEYWLAGDGPEAHNITVAAQRAGVMDRVRLLGRVSEAQLDALYHGTDLFVMPNVPVPGDMEGFGVVMLEAGLCGLPSVAARLEGISDVVEEGRNGHLVESGDARAFADCIRTYHRRPEHLREASVRASQFVAGTFSWPAVARLYVQALASLAGGHRAQPHA